MSTTTITGTDAIAFAARTGAQLHKHADPVDGAREITVDEARAIAREDVGLVWCEATEWTVSDDCGGRWPTTITAADAETALDGAEAQVQRARAAYEGAATVRVTVASDAGSWSREVSL